MIYGDEPVKWNEKKADPDDPQGQSSYTYLPSISAIMQSGNLYSYCMDNPVEHIDITGELALWLVHNWVVDDIQAKYKVDGMIKNKMVAYEFGFGFADLVNDKTGEVWEVKKSTVPMRLAEKQLAKYTSHRLVTLPDLTLKTGGTGGTIIEENSFVRTEGLDTYYVHYWDCGNGIIQYEYEKVTDWRAVGEMMIGTLIIGGIAYLIFQTGGAAAPALVPILA